MDLSVSTTCPTCGGEIDFECGSNAVHCGYCGSNHLVTGRGRVLSYYIPEKISARFAAAAAQVRLKEKGLLDCKVKEAVLVFVPFYYLIAQEVIWRMREDVILDKRNNRYNQAGDEGRDFEPMFSVTEKKLDYTAKHISRSLLAVDAPELGIHSLGFRPDVLRLSLFEKNAVGKRGRISPVTVTLEQAVDIGFAPQNDEGILARRVVSRIKSIIYFPVWVIETGFPDDPSHPAPVIVVDGVSGSITADKAPVAVLEKLLAPEGRRFRTAGFRPLKCPECGIDLPVRPKDIVFFCGGCGKAWEIDGEEFTRVPCEVVSPPKPEKNAEHFPFWVIEAAAHVFGVEIDNKLELATHVMPPGLRKPPEEDAKVPLRFFIPAFALGNLSIMTRLAASYTATQPVWEPSHERAAPSAGCYVGAEDALELAPMILGHLAPRMNRYSVQAALDAEIIRKNATLALMPFRKERFEYIDCHFGRAMPIAALRDGTKNRM